MCCSPRTSNLYTMRFLSFQLQAEVKRLEVLKMQSLKSFIEAIRAEIALLWESCYYSQEQKQAFLPFQDGEIFFLFFY